MHTDRPTTLAGKVREGADRIANTFSENVLDDAGGRNVRVMGRTLWHAILVGVLATLVSRAFVSSVYFVQELVLRRLAGLELSISGGGRHAPWFSLGESRPWLLVLMPAVGGLLCGLVIQRFAPDMTGGGADASIEGFHKHDGLVPRRTAFVRLVASVCTLGFGGSGGREGPTMQIGSGIASAVSRWLDVSRRERRILYVAGMAAGVSAVFRTPLGAALFAAEVLYRDDFESEAVVPAVLASVVAYSTTLPFVESAKLFDHAPSYLFHPLHLPWYALLAVACAGGASLFLRAIASARLLAQRFPVPLWARPAVGGLLMGALCTPAILVIGGELDREGHDFGIFGSTFGGAQLAITGATWIPAGLVGAGLFLSLMLLKLVATSITIGSGGSAGDFGPSLVIGGMIGGAVGRLVAATSGDPLIDPGAFALVGMGAFFGGIARVPLAALVLVCELCGSYDLIVPLMLASGISYVLLEHRTLYPSQRPTRALGGEEPTQPPPLRPGT